MPRAGRQQGSSIRAVMLGLSSSSGNLDFCSWARGLRSHGHPQRAAGCCVMEKVMEVTRGAGGCDPGVEESTRVLWRGNFGVEKVAKDLLCQEGYRWDGQGLRNCKETSVLWNPLKMGIWSLAPDAGYLHMEVLPCAATSAGRWGGDPVSYGEGVMCDRAGATYLGWSICQTWEE